MRKVVVTVDVSWSGDFAVVFDGDNDNDFKNAREYIKKEFDFYCKEPMWFNRDPIDMFCDENGEYAYIVWEKDQLYVQWKIYAIKAYEFEEV